MRKAGLTGRQNTFECGAKPLKKNLIFAINWRCTPNPNRVELKIDVLANSVDQEEMAHHNPSELTLH